MDLRNDIASVAYQVKPYNLILFAGFAKTKEEKTECKREKT